MASISLSTLWSRYLTSLITTTTKMCQKNPINLLAFSISYINHWYKNKIRTHSHRELSSDYAVLVTRAGIEPTLTAWEAAVLTAWPTGHNKKRNRRLPIFTGRFQPTIFGTSELNFCVRNGNRWNLTVIDTGHAWPCVMLLSLSRITLSCYPVKGCTLKTEYRTAFANRVSDQDGVKPSTY